jgi:hypothetical protein
MFLLAFVSVVLDSKLVIAFGGKLTDGEGRIMIRANCKTSLKVFNRALT